MQTITEKISELAQECALSHEVFVVDVELKSTQPKELWVFLDKEHEDVSIDVCSKISRELGFLLDAHDVDLGSFRLNVSSPGLSRPLSDLRQFPKNIGRTCRIRYRVNPELVQKDTGKIEGVNEDKILLNVEGELITIAFDQILEAKIIPTI
ncbi:MAG: ribosome maturation factor [Bacteroidetes bacterium]|nr:ribosome maturation factor [Bacteroidota bacterium]